MAYMSSEETVGWFLSLVSMDRQQTLWRNCQSRKIGQPFLFMLFHLKKLHKNLNFSNNFGKILET